MDSGGNGNNHNEDNDASYRTPTKSVAGQAHDPESVMRARIRDIFADSTLSAAQKFAAVNALRGK